MKKAVALLLSVMLLMPALALADNLENCAIASGVVSAVNHVDVVAPCSGTLDTFDLQAGDTVKSGDTLFTLQTTAFYAPEDGTVSAVFAKTGDNAAAVTARYGCCVSIEPEKLLVTEAAVSNDVTEKKNLLLHVGQEVYLTQMNNRSKTGTGRIIYVDNTNYLIEMEDADEFEVTNNLSVYLKDDYQQKNLIGRGVMKRRNDAQVQAQGRVVSVAVQPGDKVQAGQLLLEVLSPDAAPDAQPFVTVPQGGVVSVVAVQPGQQVWKGALLARVELTDELEIIASVDEMDLKDLRVGDNVTVTLDMDEKTLLKGTVTEISALGQTRANAAYYTVHVSVPGTNMLLGASASVYIPR